MRNRLSLNCWMYKFVDEEKGIPVGIPFRGTEYEKSYNNWSSWICWKLLN